MDKFKKLISVIPFCGYNVIMIDRTQQGYIYDKYFGKDKLPHFDMDDCLNTDIYVDVYRFDTHTRDINRSIDKLTDILTDIGQYCCVERIIGDDIDSCGPNISGIFKIHDYASLKLFCDLNFHKIDVLNKTIYF